MTRRAEPFQCAERNQAIGSAHVEKRLARLEPGPAEDLVPYRVQELDEDLFPVSGVTPVPSVE